MKKKLSFIAVLAVCIFACTQAIKNDGTAVHYFCYMGSSDTLCPQLPYDVRENFGNDYNTGSINFDTPTKTDSALQTPLDVFSWQTFVALNWPADGSGKPTGSIMDPTQSQKRVWEYYTDPADVFNAVSGPLALHMSATKQANGKLFHLFSKSPHGITNPANLGDFEEADGNPLIDRNGNFALYEIKLSSDEVAFINTNKLTSVSGIFAFTPTGFTLPKADSAKGLDGAIEIKASWRILTDSDNASAFYTRTADIFIDSLHTDSHKPLLIKNVTVGLVGMHIIRSTKSQASNFLIWSTFEHIDNAPTQAQQTQSNSWSFYNQACTSCKTNTPPVAGNAQGNFIWDTLPPFAKFYTTGGFGTQVVRTNPIFSYTDSVNNIWQAKLNGSVWANYRLIGTQWQVNTYGVPNRPFPRSLTNTTMETYMQDSSCINCHSGATVSFQQLRPDTTYNITTGMSFVFPVYAKPEGLLTGKKKRK